MKAKVGDWVRFYRNGALVIGIVSYRRRGAFARDEWILSTDAGEVNESDVLEVRRSDPESRTP